MGPYGSASGAGVHKNGASHLRSYLWEESVSTYIRSAYFMKAQPLLVMMVPSISVNSVFFKALRPQSGCLSEKSGVFPFSKQSGANLVSSGILVQYQEAEK